MEMDQLFDFEGDRHFNMDRLLNRPLQLLNIEFLAVFARH
jgi:hypothetical protein